MTGLTDRQAEILAFIRARYREKGYAPTIREIGAHFGIRSTNGVNCHVNRLVAKGALRKEDMKSRCLVPVEREEAPVRAPAQCEDGQGDIVAVDVVEFVRGTGLVGNVRETLRFDAKLLVDTARLPSLWARRP
jgi:repressor LexA